MRHAVVGDALGAVLVATATIFLTQAASAAGLPAPIGQPNATATTAGGCPNGGDPYFQDGGPGLGPVAVAVNPTTGRVWVTDFRNSENGPKAGALLSWPSLTAAEGCSTAPDVKLEGLDQPEGLAFDSAGNLYMTETGADSVYGWHSAQQTAPTRANAFVHYRCWSGATADTGCVAEPQEHPTDELQMQFPRGLAVGPGDKLYVADDNNNRILVFDPASPATLTPGVIIKPGATMLCHVKGVTFINGKLFAVNFKAQEAQCNNAPDAVRFDTLTAASQPAQTFAVTGSDGTAVDIGANSTKLFVSFAGTGTLASFTNADTGTGGRNDATKMTSVTLNGATGSYTLKAPEFGVTTAAGDTMLLADSGNFRVVPFSAAPPAAVGTSTAVTSSMNPAATTDSVSFTATVTQASGTTKPSGTVQFKDGATNIGTPVTLTNGTATSTGQTFSAGTHQITAVYTPADANAFSASTSPALAEVVNGPTNNAIATTTAVTSSKNPALTTDSVTFTATVTQASGTTKPSGTVQFKDGTTNIGTPVTLANGTATSTGQTLTAGTHQITAVYTPADATFTGSTSPALTQTINAPTTNAPVITVNPTTAVPGQQIAVSGTGFQGNSGVVLTFRSTPVTLGSFPTNAAGAFSVVVTIPTDAAVGAHTIAADGLDPAGRTAEATAAITVTAVPATTTTTIRSGILRVTGGPISAMTVMAAALLLLGAALLGAARQRRRVCRPASRIESYFDR
jgi:Big-like domain-containing protein/NHL repeat-containing protein